MAKSVIVSSVHKQPSKKWIKNLPDISIIIVDDSDGEIVIKRKNIEVYNYKRQEQELGKFYSGFEQFHHSSSCKNFGHWLAYKKGYDVIIGLDSDCICPKNFIEQHLKALNKEGYGWENPLYKIGWYSRGFPYSQRKQKIMVNMGLWENELDINGKDRIIKNPPKNTLINDNKIALGKIPFSGMNFACRRELIPSLFFLPNFNYGVNYFKRHDDIWGGYIMQKFLKKRKECISYGLPIIYHDTKIIAEEDVEEEKALNKYSDDFYEIVDGIFEKIRVGMYIEMLQQFEPKFEKTIFKGLIEPIKWWQKLWRNEEKK